MMRKLEGDGGQAFPHGDMVHGGCTGMTLRDYFAAKAMQGLILNEAEDGTIGSDNVEPALAKLSYQIADAMLAERAKGQS